MSRDRELEEGAGIAFFEPSPDAIPVWICVIVADN